MAVEATDLVAPQGKIEIGFFPGEDEIKTNERLASYLVEGYAKAGSLSAGAQQDAAAEAWAYHRAYIAIYTRLSITPYHAALNDQGSRTYSSQQINVFKELADEMLLLFQAQFPVQSDTVELGLRSYATPTQVTW